MTLIIQKPTGAKLLMKKESPLVWAQGGDLQYEIVDGGATYMVHEFTTVGTASLNVLKGGNVEYLVVAGGGGGGGAGSTWACGGGGGAGGYRVGTGLSLAVGAYTVSVGAKGNGGIGYSGGGQKGGDSVLGSIIATGGGGGSSFNGAGTTGGSGGGGGARFWWGTGGAFSLARRRDMRTRHGSSAAPRWQH
jgi:hypothetical protein